MPCAVILTKSLCRGLYSLHDLDGAGAFDVQLSAWEVPDSAIYDWRTAPQLFV
jgi:hypothetical protein